MIGTEGLEKIRGRKKESKWEENGRKMGRKQEKNGKKKLKR